jgi:ribosomal protein L21
LSDEVKKPKDDARLRNKLIKEAEEEIVDILSSKELTLAEVMLIFEDLKFKSFLGREMVKNQKINASIQEKTAQRLGEMYR